MKLIITIGASMMKKEYQSKPKAMENIETYGFSWIDFVTAIPSPLFVVTSYKSNGQTNACLQSWATFVGEDNNFYCIMASVNKNGHMYKTIKETNDLVINFPSAKYFDMCAETIRNNSFDDDEIGKSGLTAENSTTVNAPRIKECFLNLECSFHWEKELYECSSHIVMCVIIKNVCVDNCLFDEESGRYSEQGYIYNVHYPINPETGKGRYDCLATLKEIDKTKSYY